MPPSDQLETSIHGPLRAAPLMRVLHILFCIFHVQGRQSIVQQYRYLYEDEDGEFHECGCSPTWKHVVAVWIAMARTVVYGSLSKTTRKAKVFGPCDASSAATGVKSFLICPPLDKTFSNIRPLTSYECEKVTQIHAPSIVRVRG